MEAKEMSVVIEAIEDKFEAIENKLEALRKDIQLLSSLGEFAIRRVSSLRTNVMDRLSSMESNLQLLLEKESSRNSDKESSRIMDGKANVVTELPSEQADCAVCLERLKSDESLVHLPCAHRFHSKCLMPWLKTNANCPCCRMRVSLS